MPSYSFHSSCCVASSPGTTKTAMLGGFSHCKRVCNRERKRQREREGDYNKKGYAISELAPCDDHDGYRCNCFGELLATARLDDGRPGISSSSGGKGLSVLVFADIVLCFVVSLFNAPSAGTHRAA